MFLAFVKNHFLRTLRSEVGAFNLNQFKLKNNIGEVMNPAANTIQAQVISTLATSSYYYAGDIVFFGTSGMTSEMPMVQAVTTGHVGVGVIVYNMKKDKYSANDIVGVALDGSIITMTASGVISRNDVVGYGSNSHEVKTIGSGNGIGVSLDNASASGDIVRILVKAGIAYNAGL